MADGRPSALEARTSFEHDHGVVDADAAMYTYDRAAHQALLHDAPWRRDPHYFRHVYINVTALLKMVLHARAGGDLEVMGLMQGHVRGDALYVLDAFALPVHGTETRVNAQNEAYEYMVTYLEACQGTSRPEHAIGWYHTHPGYGCWLSGIDVQTQRTNQQQDPFIAVVIDPWRTMSSGHVDIGAFRTWPAEQERFDARVMQQHVPAHKAADYGAHAAQYYAMDVHFFKNAADRPLYDQLWQEYWAHALCAPAPMLSAPALEHAHEVATRLQDMAASIRSTSLLPGGTSYAQAARAVPRQASADVVDVHALAHQLEKRAREQPLARIADDAQRLAADAALSLEHAHRNALLFG